MNIVNVCIYMYVNIVNVCIFTIIIRIVSYRIENNHIVSLCIDTYRIVLWPYRLIPNNYIIARSSFDKPASVTNTVLFAYNNKSKKCGRLRHEYILTSKHLHLTQREIIVGWNNQFLYWLSIYCDTYNITADIVSVERIIKALLFIW